jgi:arylformamidase
MSAGHTPSGINRRALLASAAAGALLGRARAQPAAPDAARAQGAPVWRDLDQAALDAAYDQSRYAPNMAQVQARYAANSEAARARLGAPERYAYGATATEGLDVYVTPRAHAPVHIFIHGGAWRAGDARNYAFLAEPFVQAGAHFVIPDFVNVTQTGGALLPLVDQLRRAVAWVWRNAERFGGDPQRIHISGHSSGGHLAGVALTTDWQRELDLPSDVLKGGLCLSGMFDLEPVRLSSRSTYVVFDDEIEQALSPQRHLDKLRAPLIIAYGTFETPEFQRQSRDFAAAVAAAGRSAQLIVAQGYNHFEILETLGNPYGVVGRAALEQMGLA